MEGLTFRAIEKGTTECMKGESTIIFALERDKKSGLPKTSEYRTTTSNHSRGGVAVGQIKCLRHPWSVKREISRQRGATSWEGLIGK